MAILSFRRGDSVLWHGAEARVIVTRGFRIGVKRLDDGQDLITTDEILHAHQAAYMATVLHEPMVGPLVWFNWSGDRTLFGPRS